MASAIIAPTVVLPQPETICLTPEAWFTAKLSIGDKPRGQTNGKQVRKRVAASVHHPAVIIYKPRLRTCFRVKGHSSPCRLKTGRARGR